MSADSETQEARNWAPIVGRWSMESGHVRYLGPQGDTMRPYGICASDVDLGDGSVFARVSVGEDRSGESRFTVGNIVLGYRSEEQRYVMAGLGGWHRAYTIGEFEPSLGWRALATAGVEENLSLGQQYSLRVSLTGQRVSLAVDGVHVLEHVLEKPLRWKQVGLFAFGKGETDFSDFSVDQRPGKLFVVMPLCEPYKQLHEKVIAPLAKQKPFGLDAQHAGQMFGPGVILRDIEQSIVDAKVVIAELTPASESEFNPNVFYELGYAHALGKPTILLAERERVNRLPFDISGFRVLFYNNTILGTKQFEEELKGYLEAILGDSSRNGA